jgi:hypothetical protein
MMARAYYTVYIRHCKLKELQRHAFFTRHHRPEPTASRCRWWRVHMFATISVLPRQYLVPELPHMGFNIAAELRYAILPRKHRYAERVASLCLLLAALPHWTVTLARVSASISLPLYAERDAAPCFLSAAPPRPIAGQSQESTVVLGVVARIYMILILQRNN